MAQNSNIEWTEKTWNPITGCSKVSPGCAHCYAETMAKRLKAMGVKQYRDVVDEKGWTGKVTLVPELLEKPLHWKKPRMIFVNSMSDLFHEDVPDEFIDKVFATMYRCPWHVFQILTKRAKRAEDYFHGRMTYIGSFVQQYIPSMLILNAKNIPLLIRITKRF